ncbi:MAG: NfeD family protein [Candidatus Latescibacteria bacterium]|jgi:membrane-bound serine protease (ClpP class)|nr:NfeD family protein [Candidatus Latescibacterota bacterium]
MFELSDGVSQWVLITIMILAGYLLILVEMATPGMILGVIGVCAILGGLALSYVTKGLGSAVLTLVGTIAIGAMVGWRVWKTKSWRRLVHDHTAPEGLAQSAHDSGRKALIGKTGAAVTMLRPAGVAAIDGVKYDVVTEGGVIDSGVQLVVVEVTGNRVVVRPV